MTTRRAGSQIVRLCLPIATAAGRLDPPQLVRCTAAAAEWLLGHEHAQQPAAGDLTGDTIDLTGDAWLIANNARPGDSYMHPEKGQLVRRPRRGEPLGELQTAFLYARRSLASFREHPEYRAMLRAFAPAIRAMEACKAPLFLLTEPEITAIENALIELGNVKAALYARAIEAKHIAPRKKGGKARAKAAGDQNQRRDNAIFAAYNRDPDQRSFAGRKAAQYGLKPPGLRAIIRKQKKKAERS